MKPIAYLAALAITFAVSVLPSYVHADQAESRKALLITGASTGIGRYAAERIAAAG
jgi:NADPH:quinone reductase-like Zn-dependent oxidoreductase